VVGERGGKNPNGGELWCRSEVAHGAEAEIRKKKEIHSRGEGGEFGPLDDMKGKEGIRDKRDNK